MYWQGFLTVFVTVLLAEIGDKTQIATMLYAAEGKNTAMTVFIAASPALVVAAGLGVVAGSALARWLDPRMVNIAAGVAFIVLGGWILLRANAA